MSEKPTSKDHYGPPLGSTRKLPNSIAGSSTPVAVTPLKMIPSPSTPIKSSQRPTASQIVQTPSKSKSPLVPISNKYSILDYHNTISSKTPGKTEQYEYQEKPERLPSIMIEKAWFDCHPREIAKQVFPPNFHYMPGHPSKGRLFYEFILVDTDSIEVTHNKDKNGEIIYSKVKILKVLNMQEWNQPLFQSKQFSRVFTPSGYNYFDYMDAWYYFLYLRPFQHSWFVWFKKGISLRFPQWFKLWFHQVGLDFSIFPEEVQPLFKHFVQKTHFRPEERLLYFTASQAISWIMTWDWCSFQLYNETDLYQLQRAIRIKWWAKFDIKLIQKAKIDEWAKNYLLTQKSQAQLTGTPSTPLINQEALFLQEKSKIMAELASATSQEEFRSRLELVSGSQKSDSLEDEASSNIQDNNYLQENGDDCFNMGFHSFY